MIKQQDTPDIENLLEIMARLRQPGSGCPWDLAQSFETIAPYTVEEAYEVADAIERGAIDELAGELGDLLFQVVFHAQMADERDAFSFADVVSGICEKMISRHPHVFAGESVSDAQAQTRSWEASKERERQAAGHRGVLAGVPLALPGLTRASKLGRRASAVGFDWSTVEGVRAKVTEELGELDEAIAGGQRREQQAEMGDLLFCLANLCRHLDLDPEQCIREANRRFESRFGHIEQRVNDSGRDWPAHPPAQLELWWDEAKTLES